MTEDEDKYTIKAALRCLQVLDIAVKQSRPVTIQDVADALDTNTNMAFRMLATLARSGYMVKQEATGAYTPSLKSLLLARSALQSLEIRRTIMPYLELLWNQYPKANANLGVRYRDDILLIDRIDTISLPKTYFTPGKQLPFYGSALGKMLTCERGSEEIDRLLATTKIEAYTPHTLTDPEAIRSELDKVRAEGIAHDREEFITGDTCVAAPVRDASGTMVAAISLSALSGNLAPSVIESAAPKVKETADRISSLLGYTRLA